MRILILSGLSGSGKSVALHMLEDLGFYCIDNIPAALLKPFISYTVRSPESTYERTAIGLDARNTAAEIIGKLNKETCSDSGRKRRIGRPVYGVRPLWHHRRGWRVRR